MQISFADITDDTPLIASVCEADSFPYGLETALLEGAKAARFTAKPGQVFEGFVERTGADGKARVVRIALVGIGKPEASETAGERQRNLEKAGAALTARYLTSGETALAVDVSEARLSADEVAVLLTGLRLRAFRHDAYRTTLKDEQKISLDHVTVAGAPEGTAEAWAQAAAVAEGVLFTRELVTEPGNIIYPESYVERVKARFASTGIEITVLGKAEMAALGMGALLGVSQGSAREPQLLVMRWNGGAEGTPPVAFVGKGVTFDTGGISLKQPGGMEDMKWDMGGAGAVTGAMLAMALRGAKVNVIGVCGLVENMPDALAQRPGDVVTSLSGQTVEVINTDAEGRLVLCDALTWVQREAKPVAIVDLATLTGAIIATLAMEYGGLFANDDGLANALSSAGEAVGEKLWRLPMGAAYDKMIDSPIADMKNVGGRYASSITAAQFLQRYIDKGTPWAHLDIAGMVWADKAGATWDKGATGYGVRLLDRYLRLAHEA